MKKTYIFCTRWWLFLTEIPPIIILALCIFYNKSVETPQKLYPLIAFCFLVIVFIFLYFFRMISISGEEIRTIGLFSSKDFVIVEKEKTLSFTLMPRRKIRVELYGKSSAPGFSWIKGDYKESDINLYRERAIGGKGAIIRVLKFFDIPSDDREMIFKQKDFQKEYESLNITSLTEGENKVVKIYFAKTI